jgi:molecular chaperone HtpG
MSESETYMFQAEINQLMSLIINAFYSNKEIFLRELIANASDALDKYRHAILGKEGSNAVDEINKLEIKLIANKDAKTLEIVDNGIGMTRQELIDNLGTIARSGTKQFMQAMTENKDLSLIGQFGVGFYSAYLVADKVIVTSRGEGETDAYRWESTAGGSFTVTKVSESENSLERGTHITLYLKEDQVEFAEEHVIKNTVGKHSSFIGYPIQLEVHRTREVEVEDGPDMEKVKGDSEDENEEGAVEEVKNEVVPPAKTTRSESYTEWEQLNKQKPIWMRKPEDVSVEDYNGFYKSVCNDWEDPLAFKHFSVEGQMEFRGLLYIPKRAPYDMFGREKRNHIKLYVRRVFIMDDSEELIPEWLGFVRGIVDSDDLPLNVSREMLQQSRIMKVIQKNVVKKCVEMFTDMAKEKPEDYKVFYDNFSRNLKLGVYEDDKHKDKLVELLRFYSSKSGDDRTSLEDYVTRMKEGQKNIYYIAGENLAQVKNSPFIEKLRKKGYEVLYMVDTIDEYMTQRLKDYKEKKMVCVTKEGALLEDDLTEDEKKAREEQYKDVCEKIKEILGDKVEKVQISDRITDTPAVLVTNEYGWSANMERIMKAQALQGNQMAQYMAPKKTMQINPDHRIIKALVERFKDSESVQQSTTKDIVTMLFETSLINSGFAMEDPSVFVKRIHRMLELGLNMDEDEDEDKGNTTEEIKMDTDADADTETRMEELD